MISGPVLTRIRSNVSLDESSSLSSHDSHQSPSYRNPNGYEKVSIQEQPSITPTSSTAPSVTAIVASIALYASISLAIVYFNWWLFTSAFQYPVFVSWIQQVFGLILFVFLAFLGQRFTIFRHFPYTKPSWDTAKSVLPLSLSFVGMVGLANICLKFVQVSTYQIARSLTIVFTLALSYVILGEAQKPKTIISCVLMVVGFIIGSLDTTTLSFTGVLAGSFSSVFQALYNVNIKKTLQYTDYDPNLLLFYNLIWSSFLFFPVIFITGESGVFSTLQFNPDQKLFYIQWGSLLLSGVLATAMNLSSYWCVKVTSPLTFNFVGLTKSIVQTLGGIVFLGDLVSVQSIVGIVLSLGGSGWYSFLKTKGYDAAGKQAVATSSPSSYQQVELQQREYSFDIEKALKDDLALVNVRIQRSGSTSGISTPSPASPPPTRRNPEAAIIGISSIASINHDDNTSTALPTLSGGIVSSPSDSSISVIRRGVNQLPNDLIEKMILNKQHLSVSSPVNSTTSPSRQQSPPISSTTTFSNSSTTMHCAFPNPTATTFNGTQQLNGVFYSYQNSNIGRPLAERWISDSKWTFNDIINNGDKHLLKHYENLQSTSKTD